MTPSMKMTGMKMATTAMVAERAANAICRVPSRAAVTLSAPPSRCRTMFSSTMMASSTTMPTASESPSSVNVLNV